LTGLIGTVGKAIAGVIGWFLGLQSRVLGVLTGIGSWLVEAGKDLVQGLINGVKSMAGKLGDAVTGIIPGPIKRFGRALGLGSPSRLFDRFGRWTGEGYVRGINAMVGDVEGAAISLADAAITPMDQNPFGPGGPGFGAGFPPPAAGGGGVTINLYGPVYADSAGIQRLARQIVPPLRQEMNRYADSNGGTLGVAA
jgi:hypothetical protein